MENEQSRQEPGNVHLSDMTVEIRGFEPLTLWLPATRSSQLSYIPFWKAKSKSFLDISQKMNQ